MIADHRIFGLGPWDCFLVLKTILKKKFTVIFRTGASTIIFISNIANFRKKMVVWSINYIYDISNLLLILDIQSKLVG